MVNLDPQDLQDILDGACILACGGGGPYTLGQLIVPAIMKLGSVELVEPSAVDGAARMAVAAGLGAPDAAMEPGKPNIGDVATVAYDALAAHLDTKFPYVMPGELGAGNSLVPIYVAAKKGIPVVDVSGAPRAMPLLDMTTFEGHVPVTPVVMTNGHDDVVFDLSVNNKSSSQLADAFARAVVEGPGFGELAGVAMFAMTGEQMQHHGRLGTLTRARELGAALRTAKVNGSDPVAAVAKSLGGRVLFVADTFAIAETTGAGFDTGSATLTSKASKEVVTIVTQNENIIGWTSAGPEPIGMGPDFLCYLTSDGQPFSNADPQIAQQAIGDGKQVALIGAPASNFGYRSPGVVDVWMSCVNALGYSGAYVPVEDLPAWRRAGAKS